MIFGDREKKINNIHDIKKFHFSYTVGYHNEASIEYEVECNDKCSLKYKGEGITSENASIYEFDKDKLKELESILNKYKVGRWNGFNKSDHNVLDGNSFSLSIKMNNDESVSASGYMKWPKHYKEVKEELVTFFRTIIK